MDIIYKEFETFFLGKKSKEMEIIVVNNEERLKKLLKDKHKDVLEECLTAVFNMLSFNDYNSTIFSAK